MPSIGARAMSGGPGISIWNLGPRSAATSVACFVSLPRRYSTCTVSSGVSLRASCTSLIPGPDWSSSSAFTAASAVPLNLVMMSPTLRPALPAGPPGETPSILAPSLSVSGFASVRTITPMRPRLSSNEYANARGSRGGRGVRCCPTNPAGQAASAAVAITIQFRCMGSLLRGRLQPHIRGTRNADPHELLHQVHPLLPQFDEFGGTGLDPWGPEPYQLAVDDGNAILQRGRQRRRATAGHTGVGIVAAQLLLERRRLLLDAHQVGGVEPVGPDRPEHDQSGHGRRRGNAPRALAGAAPPPLREHGLPHRRPAIARGPAGRERLELRHALVQRVELGPTGGALFQVLPRPHRRGTRPERQQLFHRAVHHGPTPPASSIRRSRACARASCDFEKLTVFPISSAISSCV